MPDLWAEYRAATYGDEIADVYDGFYNEMPGWERCVELLHDLAGDGPAMELGIGTGRIAIPLAERGVVVHGIDASEAMVNKLRAKAPRSGIEVKIGDMESVEGAADSYSLIFVVFNTFFALTTQEAQIRCLRNVAKRLENGGRFLVHCFVPDLERYSGRQKISVRRNNPGNIRTDYSTVDPISQIVTSNHVVMSNGRVQTYPVMLRYCWPAELDLMARLAGLKLEDRWSDWGREPFTSHSEFHVSLYRRT